MAAAPIILGAIGGGAVGYGAATVLGLGVAGTAVATATGAVVGAAIAAPSPPRASMMAPDVPQVATPVTDYTPVDTSSPTGGADTTINDVTGVQDTMTEQADTSRDTTGYTMQTSLGTSAGATYEAAAAREVSYGPAEDEAISFYEKGLRSTILTTGQGLLTEAEAPLRTRRGLVGQGLIA